jgi:hypothetical protein
MRLVGHITRAGVMVNKKYKILPENLQELYAIELLKDIFAFVHEERLPVRIASWKVEGN